MNLPEQKMALSEFEALSQIKRLGLEQELMLLKITHVIPFEKVSELPENVVAVCVKPPVDGSAEDAMLNNLAGYLVHKRKTPLRFLDASKDNMLHWAVQYA